VQFSTASFVWENGEEGAAGADFNALYGKGTILSAGPSSGGEMAFLSPEVIARMEMLQARLARLEYLLDVLEPVNGVPFVTVNREPKRVGVESGGRHQFIMAEEREVPPHTGLLGNFGWQMTLLLRGWLGPSELAPELQTLLAEFNVQYSDGALNGTNAAGVLLGGAGGDCVSATQDLWEAANEICFKGAA